MHLKTARGLRLNILTVLGIVYAMIVLVQIAVLAMPNSFALSQVTAGRLTFENGVSESNYGQGSWAIGVVVPQGSLDESGSKINWQSITNLTAIFSIPKINNTDNTVYIIMSLMTSNEEIIQVAAGLYKNMSAWGTYGMYIQNPLGYPQEYHPVIVTASPAIPPGDFASMSLYLSTSPSSSASAPSMVWNLRLDDLNTSRSVSAVFDFDLSPTLKVGDQFVFALESYTSNSSIFMKMGNFTLSSLLLNGQHVVSGWYPYTDWDNVHYPLFDVGGADPPSFISVRIAQDYTAIWSYVGDGNQTNSYELPFDYNIAYFATAGIVTVVVALGVVAFVQTGRRGRKGKEKIP
jgi:hypothetical protein